MKKTLFLLVPLLVWGLVSCSEGLEEEAVELVFAEKHIASEDHLTLRYFSPDPGCGIPKMYWIAATAVENTLTLKCSETDSLVSLAVQGVKAGVKVTDEAGHWTAVLTDAKTLSFTFDGIDDPKEDVQQQLSVSATVDGRPLVVDFIVDRLNYAGPLLPLSL